MNITRRPPSRCALASAISRFLPVLTLLAMPSMSFAQTWGGTAPGALTGAANDATHQWNQTANWTTAVVPNAVGAAANVTADFTGVTSVFLNGPITIGALSLDDTGATSDSVITLAGGTGTPLLILDNTASTNASLTTAGATNVISASIQLNDSLDVTATNGLTLSGVISESGGAKSITKTNAAGAITLSGNNSFAGCISNVRGTINMTGVAANTVLGSGDYTFANVASSGGNTLSLNTGVSKTIANNFVNNNAMTVAAAEYAGITMAGGTSGNRLLTFNGTFTSGGSYASATQGILLGANGSTSTATAEGTIVLNGSWAGYNGSNANAVRIDAGAVLINASNAMANTGGYQITSNATTVGAKLILGGTYTMNNPVAFSAINGGATKLRNSFGARNATASTATLAGTLTLTDAAGGNVFSQTSGAILDVSGLVSGANKLRINDGYTFTTADGTTTNTLQTPTGTVKFSRATGNTNSGGVDIINGTVLVANTSGNGLGASGAITIGIVGAAVSGQSGSFVNAGTSPVSTRVINNVALATAQSLQVGQSITGTGLGAGQTITGISLNGASSVIVVSNAFTVNASSTLSFTDLATTAVTTTAVLQLGNNDATGSLAPANALTINSGSQLVFKRSDVIVQGTAFSAAAITGVGGIEQAGSGATTLNALNTFGGTTMVSGGVLALAHTGALQNSTLNTGSAGAQSVTFTVAGTNTYDLGGLQGADALDIGANTISVGANGQSTIFSGTLMGVGGTVSKMGAGTLVLSGAQNYGTLSTTAGVTSVNGAFTGGTATVNAGATTKFNASQSLAALNIADGVEVTFGDGLPFAAVAAPSFDAKDSGEFPSAAEAVPEPGSAVTLLTGLGLLIGLRRRRSLTIFA